MRDSYVSDLNSSSSVNRKVIVTVRVTVRVTVIVTMTVIVTVTVIVQLLRSDYLETDVFLPRLKTCDQVNDIIC